MAQLGAVWKSSREPLVMETAAWRVSAREEPLVSRGRPSRPLRDRADDTACPYMFFLSGHTLQFCPGVYNTFQFGDQMLIIVALMAMPHPS